MGADESNSLTSMLAIFAGGVAFFLTVVGLFWAADDAASKSARQLLADWLKEVDLSGAVVNWPPRFVEMFDGVFGDKHISERCFLRSALASICAVCLTAIVGGVFLFPLSASFLGIEKLYPTVLAFFLSTLTAISLNIIIDYISLLESRYIIGKMKSVTNFRIIISYLLADLILTIAIYVSFRLVQAQTSQLFNRYVMPELITDLYRTESINRNPFQTFVKSISIINDAALLRIENTDQLLLSALFYSTFFTSLWVWLYVISVILVKLAWQVNPIIEWLKRWLDLDEHPIKALGIVGASVTCLGYWIVAAIAYVAR